MADGEVEVSKGIPSMHFTEYENDEIELVDLNQQRETAEGEYAGKSREEIIAEVQAMKAAAQAAPAPGPSAPSEEHYTISQLKALAQLQQAQAPQGAPVESDAEFAERIKMEILDNPTKALDEVFNRKMAPMQQQLAANNLYRSQLELERDPKFGSFYKSHKAEIDAEVQALPPQAKTFDPSIYLKVAQSHAARNIDEIIELKVQEALAAQAPKRQTSPAAQFSETGLSVPGPVKQGSKKVQISLTEEEKRIAFAKGMKEKDYAAAKARREGKI